MIACGGRGADGWFKYNAHRQKCIRRATGGERAWRRDKQIKEKKGKKNKEELSVCR